MSNEQNESDAKAHPVDTLVMCWKPCKKWKDLPVGQWLVKVANERKPYHVADVFENTQGDKLIIAGGCFYFDMGELIAFTPFQEYT